MSSSSEAAVTLGANVRSARATLGYSAREAARLSHTDLSHYTRVERGESNTTLHILLRIAHALETTPTALLDGVDSTGLPDDGPAPLTRNEFAEFTRAIREKKKDEQ